MTHDRPATDRTPSREPDVDAPDAPLSERGETGETAGYIGGPVDGNVGAAGIRQMEADDADERDTETDANLAQTEP